MALLLYVGELCSKKLKGMLPSVLVSGVLIAALVWTGIVPGNIVERSGMMPITSDGRFLKSRQWFPVTRSIRPP